MLKRIFAYLQNLLPQHFITWIYGYFAEIKSPWFKNLFIKWFIKRYQVDMKEALIADLNAYHNFNEFFIRKLKPELRPINQNINSIISPVDGIVAQLGDIHNNAVFQAKGKYFDLETLLSDPHLAETYYNGKFATLYLAPHNYHRIHMPFSGKLIKTIFVPGKLFSVNLRTADVITNLYARNERLICVFKTEIGLITVILVGAMIVGSIQTIWEQKPIKCKHIQEKTFMPPVYIERGAELGLFKLGSTVILLCPPDKIEWDSKLTASSSINFGQILGTCTT